MTINEKIKTLRENLDISVAELSRRTGITVQSLYRYESGDIEKITTANIMKLAEALHVDPATLVGWSRSLNSVTCPVYSKVTPDFSDLTDDNIVGYIAVEEKKVRDSDVFGLIINDTELSPYVMRGDIVVLRKQTEVENGDTAAISLNGGDIMLRRVTLSSSKITLSRVENDPEPVKIEWRDIGGFKVIGKCIELRRPM